MTSALENVLSRLHEWHYDGLAGEGPFEDTHLTFLWQWAQLHPDDDTCSFLMGDVGLIRRWLAGPSANYPRCEHCGQETATIQIGDESLCGRCFCVSRENC